MRAQTRGLRSLCASVGSQRQIPRVTREIQKREEVALVEHFRRNFSAFPSGALRPSNEPDVLLAAIGKTIGIEVTELHQRPHREKTPRRIQESERDSIVGQARELAVDRRLPPVDVAVYFSDAHPVLKRNRREVAGALVSLVAAHLPDADGIRVVRPWEAGEVLRSVRYVHIWRASVLSRHHWAVPDGGAVQEDFVDELQTVLDAKNLLYASYRLKCDGCWLLIVASGARPSGAFEPSDATKSHVYRSRFDRTFFMEAFKGQVLELKSIKAA